MRHFNCYLGRTGRDFSELELNGEFYVINIDASDIEEATKKADEYNTDQYELTCFKCYETKYEQFDDHQDRQSVYYIQRFSA